MCRTSFESFIRFGGAKAFILKPSSHQGFEAKQNSPWTREEAVRQWVDDVWNQSFGATTQAILKTKPFEFSAAGLSDLDMAVYLDTRGFVTVGKGKMLPAASDAVALAFLRQGTDVPASEDEIRAEYDLIAGMVEDVGRNADYFGKFTNLYLPQADVDRLVTDHMRGDFEALLRQYPGFGNLPLSAQIALWDMIYNLGPSRLAQFRLLRQAILDGDWEEAARQSHRQGPSEERNQFVFDLFMDAAEEP